MSPTFHRLTRGKCERKGVESKSLSIHSIWESSLLVLHTQQVNHCFGKESVWNFGCSVFLKVKEVWAAFLLITCLVFFN